MGRGRQTHLDPETVKMISSSSTKVRLRVDCSVYIRSGRQPPRMQVKVSTLCRRPGGKSAPLGRVDLFVD